MKYKKWITIAVILSSALFLLFFVHYYDASKPQKEQSAYSIFITSLKGGNDKSACHAYFKLYPLVMNKDSEAMKLVSEAYAVGFGVPMDLVKSNIWLERSQYHHFNTGSQEFQQFEVFLNQKNYGMASVFLQEAAKKGNKQAILILQNQQYMQENQLEVDKNWVEYWHAFVYDDLYPFQKEIDKYYLDASKCPTP